MCFPRILLALLPLLLLTTPLRAQEDPDGDGLSTAQELAQGTDPHHPDSDRDGLLDGWEVDGLPGLDLPALGASPLHRDVFVEMDWVKPFKYPVKPSSEVLRRLVAIFQDATVDNPDGTPGIRLHLELGEEIPWMENLDVEVDSEVFANLKEAHFDPARLPVYHYMIWADHLLRGGGTGSTGFSFGIPHSDFVVALGVLKGGSEDQQVGTFLHELGHNLGLRHGSTTNSHRKPNHLSVMSYNFQLLGLLRDRSGERFDLQRFPIPALDEDHLDELRGLGEQPLLRGYETIFFFRRRPYRSPAFGPLDFNRNGVSTDTDFHQDLNKDFRREILVATPNEWQALQYTGASIGSRGPVELLRMRGRAHAHPVEEPPVGELLLELPGRKLQ
jgi:hypothetical protein